MTLKGKEKTQFKTLLFFGFFCFVFFCLFFFSFFPFFLRMHGYNLDLEYLKLMDLIGFPKCFKRVQISMNSPLLNKAYLIWIKWLWCIPLFCQKFSNSFTQCWVTGGIIVHQHGVDIITADHYFVVILLMLDYKKSWEH